MRNADGSRIVLAEDMQKIASQPYYLNEELGSKRLGAKLFPEELHVPYNKDEMYKFTSSASAKLKELREFAQRAKLAEQELTTRVLPHASQLREVNNARAAAAQLRERLCVCVCVCECICFLTLLQTQKSNIGV
jgi:hypothetical protein